MYRIALNNSISNIDAKQSYVEQIQNGPSKSEGEKHLHRLFAFMTRFSLTESLNDFYFFIFFWKGQV